VGSHPYYYIDQVICQAQQEIWIDVNLWAIRYGNGARLFETGLVGVGLIFQ
jgi:hypothetical protein